MTTTDTGDHRVRFDFEIDFANGGGIQGQGFRLDIEGADISDEELAEHLIRDLRLLMVRETRILSPSASTRILAAARVAEAALAALGIARRAGCRRLEGQALAALAATRLAQRRYDEAARDAKAALTIHLETGHRPGAEDAHHLLDRARPDARGCVSDGWVVLPAIARRPG
ncbi:hypothetical protein [Flindersiella endophytica]